MKNVLFACISVCIIAHLCYAVPKGYITYIILKASFEALELQAENGTPQLVRLSGEYISGVDAAPFLGNKQVIYEAGSQKQKNGIKILGRTGDVVMVVSAADVTDPRDPGISFDGTRIVYVSRNAGTSDEDILHVARVTGEDDAIIYTTPPGKDSDIYRPRFTPDGSSLVFDLYDLNEGYHALYRIPVTGGVPQKLEGLPYNSQEPALSPDGTWLAFTIKSNNAYYVFIAHADGTNPRQVNLGGDYARYPAFSPDSVYFAVFTQNGINIVNTKTFAVARRVNFNHSGGYGLCWHLGASKSAGEIAKLKISRKSVSIKTQQLLPPALPSYGLTLVDGVALPFDDPALWINKKDKKIMYNNKALKQKATIGVKNGKGSVSAKKLQLVEGTDYHPERTVPVGINMGDVSIVEIIPLDSKGRYTAPK